MSVNVGYVNEAIYVTIYVVVKPELKNSSKEKLIIAHLLYNLLASQESKLNEQLIKYHFNNKRIRVVQSWMRAFGFLQLDDNLIDLLVNGAFPKSQSPVLVWLSQNHSRNFLT